MGPRFVACSRRRHPSRRARIACASPSAALRDRKSARRTLRGLDEPGVLATARHGLALALTQRDPRTRPSKQHPVRGGRTMLKRKVDAVVLAVNLFGRE